MPDWKPEVVKELSDGFNVFNDDCSSEVQAEVQAAWNAIDRKGKSAIRKSAIYKIIDGDFAKAEIQGLI